VHQQQDCCSAQNSHTQQTLTNPATTRDKRGRKQQKEQMLFFTLVTGAARNPPFRTIRTIGDKKQGPTGIVWVIVVLHSWAPGTMLRHSLFKACQHVLQHQALPPASPYPMQSGRALPALLSLVQKCPGPDPHCPEQVTTPASFSSFASSLQYGGSGSARGPISPLGYARPASGLSAQAQGWSVHLGSTSYAAASKAVKVGP
jgi:hypothetical protein